MPSADNLYQGLLFYFRVHQFTKVEMFGVTANETGTESIAMHEEIVAVQEELLSALGLPLQVLWFVFLSCKDISLSYDRNDKWHSNIY